MAHEKLAIAGRLSASIAHEIHNPLDSVANLHYLMANENDPALQQRYLGMAQQELNRTLQISRAMLGLYREPKAPVEVELRELLASVLLLLDRQLKDQSVKVRPETGRRRFRSGVSRRVAAGVHQPDHQCSGCVGTRRTSAGTARALAPRDNRPGAMVTISDSGPGIPPELQTKLFQPFFTTKGEQGTGLGLWVSRGIVEKHGGTIELSNSSDPAFPGAVVRVYLPALGPATAMAAAGNYRSSQPIA